MRIRVTRQALTPATLPGLESRWRELERRADPSIFQSWTWVGCQAGERFDAAWLLEAVDESGTTQALALFNRRGRRLHLHETGDPALDAPFIEHNGPLVATGHADLVPALFRALPASLSLSGIDAATGRAALPGRSVISATTRKAPVLGLLRPVLETVGPNTRAQLRRALRRYGEWGPLSVERAATPDAARAALAELIALHDLRWQARGRPGAFADPRTVMFHHALIDRGVVGGEVDLLRIAAGGRTVGLLYNLRRNGRVFAYQAGFAYADATAHPSPSQLKPGLVCHALAADRYRTDGADSYDFGAGDARYKRSLSTGAAEMHWLTLASPWSPRAAVNRIMRRVMRCRSAQSTE